MHPPNSHTKRVFSSVSKLVSLGFFVGACLFPFLGKTQPLQGFQTNRYEPTAPGEWGFYIDHPWYSSVRYFAVDFTLDYAYRPLVFGTTDRFPFDEPQGPVPLEHQIFGHLNLAGSFLDRVQISVSWPLTFYEQGTPTNGIAPLSGVGLGDPRFGLMLRLAGQPYKDGISLNIGANAFLPLRKFTDTIAEQVGDQEARVIPKIVLAGVLRNEGSNHAAVWAFTSNFYYRSAAKIGNEPVDNAGNTTGSQLQFGLAIGYGNIKDHFQIGLEALFGTDILRDDRFTRGAMNLDLLLGTHIPLGRFFTLSLAGGVGVLHQAATADARFLAKLAFAPWPKEQKEPILVRPIEPVPASKPVPTPPAPQAPPSSITAAATPPPAPSVPATPPPTAAPSGGVTVVTPNAPSTPPPVVIVVPQPPAAPALPPPPAAPVAPVAPSAPPTAPPATTIVVVTPTPAKVAKPKRKPRKRNPRRR